LKIVKEINSTKNKTEKKIADAEATLNVQVNIKRNVSSQTVPVNSLHTNREGV
jgi:hypothetical protein